MGEISSLCKDQHGCSRLQKKREEGVPGHRDTIFREIFGHFADLMTGKQFLLLPNSRLYSARECRHKFSTFSFRSLSTPLAVPRSPHNLPHRSWSSPLPCPSPSRAKPPPCSHCVPRCTLPASFLFASLGVLHRFWTRFSCLLRSGRASRKDVRQRSRRRSSMVLALEVTPFLIVPVEIPSIFALVASCYSWHVAHKS